MSDNIGLARLRIAFLFVAYTLLGAASGAIFDSFEWGLVLAPMVPTVVALAVVAQPALIRVSGAIVAILASVIVAVIIAVGTPGDVIDAFTSGVQRLLSTDWPSPLRADLIGTVAAVIATATALSEELAARRRWHLLPLLPLAITYVAVVALSAPNGVNLSWLLALAVISTFFATLRNEGSLGERLLLLRGERRLVPLIVTAGMLAAFVSVPVGMAARANPRRNEPAQRSAPLLDPIEATLALQDLDPAADLYIVGNNAEGQLPKQWRTAALESYDGERWSPSLTLRPIGHTLGPVTGPVIDVDLRIMDDNLSLVPLPGPPVLVAANIETDADRTVVRLVEPPGPDTGIAVTTNIPATREDAADIAIATREVDDDLSGLTGLAETLGGDTTTLGQLEQIEQTMRDEFVLDSAAQGGGLQRALIERFLRDTQRGNAEQFATSFVLLARSLGVDARVATGFTTPDPPVSEELTIASSDARIWPEVRLVDGRWLAFSPAPLEETSSSTPPPPEPQLQTPAAPQPPIAPPPDPTNDATPIDESPSTSETSTLSAAVTFLLQGLFVVGALLLPLVFIAALILAMKSRRRRRHLNGPAPADRIRGAWAAATDALVDAGMTIGRSATDAEIANEAEPLAATANRELHRLATLSSAATYGNPARPDLLVVDAATCLGVLETTMGAERTLWQRLRWRLSLRSLRTTTRSPVS